MTYLNGLNTGGNTKIILWGILGIEKGNALILTLLRMFENPDISYIGAKGSIDPIQPIFDIQTYYYQERILSEV